MEIIINKGSTYEGKFKNWKEVALKLLELKNMTYKIIEENKLLEQLKKEYMNYSNEEFNGYFNTGNLWIHATAITPGQVAIHFALKKQLADRIKVLEDEKK